MSTNSPSRAQGPIIPAQQALEFIPPTLHRIPHPKKTELHEEGRHANRRSKRKKMMRSRSPRRRGPARELTLDEEIERLQKEMLMIDNETHPELLRLYDAYAKRRKLQKELEDVEAEIVGKSMAYQRTCCAARRFPFMTLEAAEQKRLEAEIEAKEKEATQESDKRASQIVEQLLNDYDKEIKKSFGPDSKGKARNSEYAEVVLSKGRFVYNNKSYKPGEEVHVETKEYGRIPAKIDTINDEVVLFKSTFTWDVRQICASLSDFAEGRVIIHTKKRANQ
ncbi:unnamed protein product, partial [Mesorhabditis spiculigera]